jgi:hypothetical protein
MTFKTKATKIDYVQGIHHNANFSEMRAFYRRARPPDDLRFYFGCDNLFSLFLIGALTDFSKTAAHIINDDLSSTLV